MEDRSELDEADLRRRGSSRAFSPGSKIRLPFLWIWTIDSHDSYVVPGYVRCEEYMKALQRDYEIARKVFVTRILFNDLVRIDGIENFTSRDLTPLQTQVHMVRPEDTAAAHTSPNECQRLPRYFN